MSNKAGGGVRWLRNLRSGDVELAVFEQGDPEAPTVLLVHGYPDTHLVWNNVANVLSDRFHVVAYDTRGSGRSSAPGSRAGYRLDRLAQDLLSVADAVSPGRPVHVVGHDWGSIQAWEAVTEPEATTRIASFTSISGPCLDHVGYWMRRRLAAPNLRNLKHVLGQQLRSWYIVAFRIPVLPELVWRRFLGSRWSRLLVRLEKVPTGHVADTLREDAVHGLELYRANIHRRVSRPRARYTGVPVQVIVPKHDLYLSPALADDLEQWAPGHRRCDLDAGHWAPATHPDAVVRLIVGFVAEHEGESGIHDAAGSG